MSRSDRSPENPAAELARDDAAAATPAGPESSDGDGRAKRQGKKARDRELLAASLELPAGESHPADTRLIALADVAEIENCRPTYFGITELAASLHAQGQL